MFEIYLSGNEILKKSGRKALTFSLSLLFHSALIIAIIVLPLLHAEAILHEFKSTEVLIAPPFLPGVPPGPGGPGRPNTTTPEPPKGGNPGDHGEGPIVLTAPVEVPTTIEEDPTIGMPEEIYRPGIVGGPGDGKSPWIMGEEIKTAEIIPDAGTKTIVRAPRLIKRVSPEYPQLPLLARRSGQVVIEASTDIYGRVQEAHIITGDILFDEAALKAVRQWIYEPYYINAIPMPVKFTVTITFNLETR